MKHWLLLPLLLTATPTLAGNWFGSGPWANGAYYPGYLNGKYMGVVTGDDGLAGVLGFAIADGAPPFRVTDQQTSAGGLVETIPLVNQQITPDVLQNYFAIFVEGRTYSGITFAGVDIERGTVAGALQGQNPVGLPGISVTDSFDDGAFDNATVDALSVVNRGLSGGFTADIDSDKATLTFSGEGELSTPANVQTIVVSADPIGVTDPVGPPPRPANTITNERISGIVFTETTDFTVRGIRTSFSSANPALVQDAATGGGAQ